MTSPTIRNPTRPGMTIDDRDQPGDRPGELEPRLELGERPAAVGLRGVALDDALERQAADGGGEVDGDGEPDAGGDAADERGRRCRRPPTSASAPASIASSRDRPAEPSGEMALPAIVPSADSPTATANHAVPAVCVRSQKARRKNTNPTLARSTSIATAASCKPDRVQLHPSRPAARAWPPRRRRAAGWRSPGRRRRTPRSRSASPSPLAGVSWSRAAGMTARNPVSPAITPSLELASTSSASVRTTDGTSACFDTR